MTNIIANIMYDIDIIEMVYDIMYDIMFLPPMISISSRL
jgi:hypothetical protein